MTEMTFSLPFLSGRVRDRDVVLNLFISFLLFDFLVVLKESEGKASAATQEVGVGKEAKLHSSLHARKDSFCRWGSLGTKG